MTSLVALLWLLTCAILFLRYFGRGAVLYDVTLFGLFSQYFICIVTVLLYPDIQTTFVYSDQAFLWATVYILICGILSTAAARAGAVTRTNITSPPKQLPPQAEWPFILICFAALTFGFVIFLRAAQAFSFEDRLSGRAGAGILFLSGYSGLIYSFFLARKVYKSLVAWYLATILTAPVVALFIVAGYRAMALTPFVSIGIAYLLRLARSGRGVLLFTVALAFAVWQPASIFTSALRVELGSGHDWSMSAISARMQQLAEARTIPLQNAHAEMTAFLIDKSSSLELATGTYDTIGSSLLNFLPRSLFPEKGPSTGVVMTAMLFPEWISSYGQHTSSVTTGLFLEALYNFGFFLGPVLLGVLYYSAARTCQRLVRQRHDLHAAFGLYLAWLLGFNSFFDDLGGVVNKAVLGTIGFFLLFSLSLLGGYLTVDHARLSFVPQNPHVLDRYVWKRGRSFGAD